MKSMIVALTFSALAVARAVLSVRRVDTGVSESSCIQHDLNRRVFVQSELAALGPNCESMCRKTGAYPNCQCAGFEGNAASDGDMRACIEKYCQDPNTPCPTDNFVACVKANTKVSTLQWSALLQRLGSLFGQRALGSVLAETTSANATVTCQERDVSRRALLQTALAVLGPDCEAMCKQVGQYPNCQCAGFEGNAASDEDARACMTKYCQDPKTPCPTDNFIACVKGNTKVSTLQWHALFQQLGSFVNSYKTMAAPKA
jgi:molybdopterin/thiamine biosynthesis adenylyltransferase